MFGLSNVLQQQSPGCERTPPGQARFRIDLGAEGATRPSRTPIPPPGPVVPWSVYRGGRTLRGQPGHQGIPDGKKQNVLRERDFPLA